LIKEYAKNFGTMTDDQALSLIKRSLAVDESITQLRIKYVPIVNNGCRAQRPPLSSKWAATSPGSWRHSTGRTDSTGSGTALVSNTKVRLPGPSTGNNTQTGQLNNVSALRKTSILLN
jgi:hypothetical protein